MSGALVHAVGNGLTAHGQSARQLEYRSSQRRRTLSSTALSAKCGHHDGLVSHPLSSSLRPHSPTVANCHSDSHAPQATATAKAKATAAHRHAKSRQRPKADQCGTAVSTPDFEYAEYREHRESRRRPTTGCGSRIITSGQQVLVGLVRRVTPTRLLAGLSQHQAQRSTKNNATKSSVLIQLCGRPGGARCWLFLLR